MPELPEVEMVVRSLRQDVIGKRILDIKIEWPRHISGMEPGEFRERVGGATITHLHRRGKYILFTLDTSDTMIIHLKMTGQLLLQPTSSEMQDHVHTMFVISGNEELRFRDVRKFGRIYLTRNAGSIVGDLGPEPLSASFSPELLHEMLQSRRRVLKPLLLDQRFIAGIGNIYADESLFGSKIAPSRISNSLYGPKVTGFILVFERHSYWRLIMEEPRSVITANRMVLKVKCRIRSALMVVLANPVSVAPGLLRELF